MLVDFTEFEGMAVAINPAEVSSIKPSSDNENVAVLKMHNGDRIVVEGKYDEVKKKLNK